MGRRGGLGRGLGALITAGEPVGTAEQPALRQLPVANVQPNRYQPREHFDDDALAELAASIRELGVLQPILVRPAGNHFEIIAGERRWRASQIVGLPTIPAIVRVTDDTASLEQALVENTHRQDLSALEEAAAFQQLADEFRFSFEQIGQRVGKSRSAVANAVRLLQLPPSIQLLVKTKAVSPGHARALLPLESTDLQELLAERIVEEGLSVRATEEAVRLVQAQLEKTKLPTTADRSGGDRPPGLYDFEELLAEHLDTRVEIAVSGRERGRITFAFAGLDDLERLCQVIVAGRQDVHG